MTNLLLKKVEFHEAKSRNLIRCHIEAYFYVEDVEKFLTWCADDEWTAILSKKSTFDYHMVRVNRSKAKRPHFEMTIGGRTVRVYPRENLVITMECGIHYICQHIFDIFPHESKHIFYCHKGIDDWTIGKLYPMKKDLPALDVKASDILDGFMLHREGCDKYHDSFVKWIQHRRDEDND